VKWKSKRNQIHYKNHDFYNDPDDSNGMEIMLGIVAFGMIIAGAYVLLHDHFPLPREVELKNGSYSIPNLKSEW
jgi:hypothetical protein